MTSEYDPSRSDPDEVYSRYSRIISMFVSCPSQIFFFLLEQVDSTTRTNGVVMVLER